MERNKLIRLFALLPLATVLTMCTDDMAERGLGYDEAHTPIALNVAFEQQEEADTRASNTINNTGFATTYQFLRLFADQNDDNYTQYATTYKPTAATTIAVQSGAAVPYFKAGETTVNVYGWYPALDNDKSFTVQNDQSTQDNYVKSDLLLADKVQSTRNLSTGVVTAAILPFRHAMSKIVLNVTAGDGVTVNNVRLAGVKKTVAINDATKTALTLGSASGDAGEVTVHSTSFTSSSGQQTMAAVIPPQSVNGDFVKVNVTVGGASRDVTFALGTAKTLTANQTYTLTMTVNKENIGATLTITGWDESSSAVNIEPTTTGGGATILVSDEEFTYGDAGKNITGFGTGARTYTVESTNTSIATVTNVSGTGSSASFTLTPQNAGTTTVTITEPGTDPLVTGTFTVAVNKAAQTPSLSTTSLTVGGIGNTGTFTVTRSGNGNITAVSSKTSIATTSVNQETGVVTVTNVAIGNATITVTVAEGDNYLAYTASDKQVAVTTIADPGIPAADVTSTNISLGWYLAKNGKVYEKKSDADGIGTGAVAAIAYIGTLDKYFDKFLAIALEDAAASYAYWSPQLTAVNTWAGTHAVTIGSTTYNTGTTGSSKYDTVSSSFTSVTAAQTPPASLLKGWRMPSMTDINAAVNGLGAGNYATLRDWFSTHGGTNMQSSYYWSSSEDSSDSSNAWYRTFNNGSWYSDSKTGGNAYVRAVFAY